MMAPISLSELVKASGGNLIGQDKIFADVFTDSRKPIVDGLFVALRGENFDGHAYVKSVAEAGASAALVDTETDVAISQIKVPNTLKAFGDLGAVNRDKFDGLLIALTGSCGKTTTKEMLASIFSVSQNVLATAGNLNNEIGVPQTLLKIAPEHEAAIIEMGAAAVGDIQYLCDFVKPDIALVTNAQAVHIEGFGSVEGVAKGKGEIYSSLSESGVAIINADDRFAGLWRDLASGCAKTICFSLTSKGADVWAETIDSSETGTTFNLCTREFTQPIQLNLPGAYMVANALAASSVALSAGITPAQIAQGLATVQNVAGRMQVHAVGAMRIIDDSYNANPAAVKIAIDTLKNFIGRRRVLVMGNMAELGADAKALHAEIGEYAASAGVTALYACGEHANAMASAFGEGAYAFAERDELIESLKSGLGDSDQVLVKGSRSAGMEKVVETLIDTFSIGGVANAAISS